MQKTTSQKKKRKDHESGDVKKALPSPNTTMQRIIDTKETKERKGKPSIL